MGHDDQLLIVLSVLNGHTIAGHVRTNGWPQATKAVRLILWSAFDQDSSNGTKSGAIAVPGASQDTSYTQGGSGALDHTMAAVRVTP